MKFSQNIKRIRDATQAIKIAVPYIQNYYVLCTYHHRIKGYRLTIIGTIAKQAEKKLQSIYGLLLTGLCTIVSENIFMYKTCPNG
jgi:hypothetical protein